MFGFLKKKLKEATEKITKAIYRSEEDLEKKDKGEEILVPPKTLDERVSKPTKIEKPAKKKSLLKRIAATITEKKIQENEIEPIIEDIKISLISSDVALEVSEEICSELKKSLVGRTVKRNEVKKIVRLSLESSLFKILNQKEVDLLRMSDERKPLKIVFLGFNGTGKTTTIARLGKLFIDRGKKVLFAAGDTWRAAAIDQLEVHGKNLGIDVIKHKYGADPAAVIFDAIKAAEARGVDVVLADTAGRSHTNVNLVEELKKIIRVSKPDLKILVVDCLTGNDAVEQAKFFDKAVGVDGLILTKADVYDKGGAVLSTAHAIKKPILYIGTGQGYDDLKKFSPSELIENLLS